MRYICRMPVVIGQIACRQSVTRQIALEPRSRLVRPAISFCRADGFHTESCRLLPGHPPTLLATVAYRLEYADGSACLSQTDRAVFELPLPAGAAARGRVKIFVPGRSAPAGGTHIRLEAVGRAFGPLLCPQTGALILTIGVFFIVRRERRLPVGLAGVELPCPPAKGGKPYDGKRWGPSA